MAAPGRRTGDVPMGSAGDDACAIGARRSYGLGCTRGRERSPARYSSKRAWLWIGRPSLGATCRLVPHREHVIERGNVSALTRPRWLHSAHLILTIIGDCCSGRFGGAERDRRGRVKRRRLNWLICWLGVPVVKQHRGSTPSRSSVIGWSHARTTLVGRLKAASGRRCDMPDPNSVPLVHCSNCQALYQVVKAQAGPETVDLEIACRVCNGPLTAREGQFVLKYCLLREASRLDIRRAARGFLRAKKGRSRPRRVR
jgi:hypothetical protein